MELFLAIMIGMGLSISAGFRVFTPLLIASIAAKIGWLPLSEGFEWISSTPALIAFSIALVLEVACNYIPVIDNAMKAIATPLALIAGTLLSISVIGVEDSPFLTWGLAFVTGGGTATVTQLTSSAVRGTSTVTTAGMANPIIALVEDAVAMITSVLSILIPIVVLLFIAIMGVFVVKIINKMKKRKHFVS